MDNRWQRIQELFHAAIDLRGESRAKFLDQACGDDAELRRELDAVLASSGKIEGLIREAVDDATNVAADLEQLPPGTEMGWYRVVQGVAARGSARGRLGHCGRVARLLMLGRFGTLPFQHPDKFARGNRRAVEEPLQLVAAVLA